MVVRILYVEDNEDNIYMLSTRLRRKGYEVIVATDGEQGVARALSDTPALILMDLSLPKLDGLAATRRIREQNGAARVPIVAVSAHDTTDFHADALAAGCDEYVTKPIDFDQLEELLTRLLGNSR